MSVRLPGLTRRLAAGRRPACLWASPGPSRSHSRSRGLAGSAAAAAEPQKVVPAPWKPVSVPDVTVQEHVWKDLARWEGNTLIECAVSGRRLTYAEARDRARRLAVSLQRLGLRPGDVLAVALPNGPDFPVVLLGALEAGLVVSPINPAYTAGEIAQQMQLSGARCALADPGRLATVRAAAASLAAPGSPPLPLIQAGPGPAADGAMQLEQLTDPGVDLSALTDPGTRPEHLAVLPFSSGTTGLPKGVMLSHRNLVSNMCQLHSPEVALSFQATPDFHDVFPAVLPFFHIYGLVVVLLDKVGLGAQLLTLPKFDPAVFIDVLQKHQCTGLFLVPPLILFLAQHPAVSPHLLEQVKFVLSGAAPLGPEDVERLRPRLPAGAQVMQGYGLTETSPVVCQGRPEKPAGVGAPLPSTDGLVLDVSSGEPLGPGQEGEVCFRGPQVMQGYLNNPEATAHTLRPDGFIRTGDIGYYDEDGDFFIVDRVKELIKVKGFQVAPAELEAILRTHPGVRDAAVVGVPDSRAGEAPRAYVVAQPGAAPPAERDLQEFVAARVAKHKQLTGGVRLLAELPRNASGKILRRQLRDLGD